ncbi:2-oxoisovalerate dehydrogenase E2 component (dihydrolipoyl transacylase) [Paenibacillus harenae]|uniref:Dihydrolipoamide acetyltransferase component of pyruvate dehydrogenase complex n=1 Tax=Paenibacillus harenae TaxID=306543 RepID=A0ABT9TW70_PAEHA|nr:2-oxoisovalerate dehydrogenase E2 component (dihydrolipoyl transacylase) [Paenibacillus harenae]MDQ0111615.1 2-oxoisovalerate dehydrogenase E2 component (dihydrolipoyl transacylase) [Paenibacillus harenae]
MKTMIEIVVPQLAESLVSATIDKWLKQPGDWVDIYEPICEILTDKVNAELPSTVSGTLMKILVGNGETVPVGTPIAIMEVEGEAADTGTVASGGTANTTSATAHVGAALSTSAGTAISDADAPMRGRFSPAVQQLATEHNLRLSEVPGTGLGGRITRKDVLAFVASGAAGKSSGASQATQVSSASMDPKAQVRSSGIHLSESPRLPKIEVEGSNAPSRGETFIDVTPIRSTIARNMRQSVSEIPHAWTMIEVDVTNLVLLRNKLKDEFMKREGVNLTYLAFLLKAVVNAIKDFPIMNSVWAVDKIIVKRDINISLAVGTEDSVMTPVIKNADHKNVAGLAKEIEELARKTREGKLTLSDMHGGTFTVNNTGSFGSILSYPIINYPQAAILTFESIVKRPVVINDMIAVRSMANLCLSLDHRILDGVICGRFLQRVKENLESFTTDSKLY